MMEPAAFLGCIFECGSPLKLPFHYKITHKDKTSKCKCVDAIFSGICIDGVSSKRCGSTPKCSSYNSSSDFNFNPTGKKALGLASSKASGLVLRGSLGLASPRTTGLTTPVGAKPYSTSNLDHTSSFDNNNLRSFTNNKIDLTNKVCNRCGVAKQITSFDKKKAI